MGVEGGGEVGGGGKPLQIVLTQSHSRLLTCNPMAFWSWSSVMLTCRNC